ncbi:hypothetical protein LTR36_007041 [Oleoguttula mirabilis]|uniref:S-adenosyl-L-methionine-dependent methyltransferase n=1 Tax=Oleoguttula mirabilis TaxID=1507867 RepID=A0AAV9JAY2_9PEZI|nr:hypothetical protein LTR36_007041 [Oleoguttula mirabilis]
MPRAAVPRHVVTALRRASTARPPTRVPRAEPAKAIDPSQPIGPASSAADPSAFARARALPWALSSLVGAGLGFYCLQLYMAASKPCRNPAIAELAQQTDVAERYDYTAAAFDSEVGFSELLMGVNGLRKKLSQKCTGHVLEVSCGTGRNLGYYDIGKEGQVDSLTFVDLSPQMVEVCRKKWAALFGSQKEMSRLKQTLQVRFMTGSALDSMPLAPTGRKYDTIIQTMGLCSTPSPAALLTNMVQHLDTSNPQARILLLEHGRSYMPWVNNILDNSAQKHAEIHGCWYNRDIGALVEEAARQTGLEVVNERRHHFGTTWVFELKPKAETVQREAAATAVAGELVGKETESGGWLSKLGWS